jgi:hypothetical protein
VYSGSLCAIIFSHAQSYGFKLIKVPFLPSISSLILQVAGSVPCITRGDIIIVMLVTISCFSGL